MGGGIPGCICCMPIPIGCMGPIGCMPMPIGCMGCMPMVGGIPPPMGGCDIIGCDAMGGMPLAYCGPPIPPADACRCICACICACFCNRLCRISGVSGWPLGNRPVAKICCSCPNDKFLRCCGDADGWPVSGAGPSPPPGAGEGAPGGRAAAAALCAAASLRSISASTSEGLQGAPPVCCSSLASMAASDGCGS